MPTAPANLRIAVLGTRTLLHCAVLANARREYLVTFTPAEGETVSEHSLLRVALHYYARVLYEIARRRRSVQRMRTMVDAIASAKVDWRTDLFSVAGVSGRIVTAVREPVGQVAVALRRVEGSEFDVDGSFGFSGRPLEASVVAVLQAAASRLSADGVDALLAALANMNMSYMMGHHYRDEKSCRKVPSIGYLAASFL